MAVDLRLVLAILHINLHLERMADLCVTISKLTKLARGFEGDPQVLESFEEMGLRAEEMVGVAMRSLVERDLAAAESLVDLDELIDRANRRLVRHVLAVGGDETKREWGLRMIVISRCLERFGDHTVDIGEQVAYLVTGELREFSDASHVRRLANHFVTRRQPAGRPWPAARRETRERTHPSRKRGIRYAIQAYSRPVGDSRRRRRGGAPAPSARAAASSPGPSPQMARARSVRT